MLKKSKKYGFSLAETLIALGILAVGMVFIAGAFPVAIQLMTQSTERSIAAVVAEEAFAKIRLYGGRNIRDINLLGGTNNIQYPLEDFNCPAFPEAKLMQEYEFTYPSTGAYLDPNSQYCWSALVRETAGDNSPTQVTVFVCRKTGRTMHYYKPRISSPPDYINDGYPEMIERINWPKPVKIRVLTVTGVNDQLQINDESGTSFHEYTFVNDGYTIIDHETGQLYRVVKRLPHPNDNIIQLDRIWTGGSVNLHIWAVPPAVGGGRNPCIGVFQKEIKF